jgi:HAD superfamily hydrolase (TIGR01509 family)
MGGRCRHEHGDWLSRATRTDINGSPMSSRSHGLRAVFWDNDGVLVDTEELYFDATRTVLEQAGFALGIAEYVDIGLRQGRSMFELVREAFGDREVERLRGVRNALYAERLAGGVAALDGVEPVLAALHGRVAMGVVTSSNPDHFELIHRGTGLLRYFDFVLTNRDYAHSKPHPAPYLAALERCGLAPEQCIAVEDSERGLAAARAAGLRCIVVPRGLTRGGDFNGAYRILDDAHDIGPLIASLIS